MKSSAEITAYLNSTRPPWIAVLPSKQWSLEGLTVSQQSHLSVIEIDGMQCQTKSALLRHFAERLRFPDYFGDNWDAFEECIRDLEWLPARGYVIVIVQADQLLDLSKTDLRIFVDIMNSAGEEWATSNGHDHDRPKPFHTILLFPPEQPTSSSERSPVRTPA